MVVWRCILRHALLTRVRAPAVVVAGGTGALLLGLFEPSLGLFPVFLCRDPLGINATTLIRMPSKRVCLNINLPFESANLPPFRAPNQTSRYFLTTEGLYNNLCSLIAARQGHEKPYDMNPWWGRRPSVRELLELFYRVSGNRC